MDGMLVRLEGKDAAAPFVRPKTPKRAGRAAVQTRRPGRSIQEYKKVFLQQYKRGFSDPGYLLREREYKVEASDLLASSLGGRAFASLMRNGNYDEVCRRALAVVNKTNLLYPNEKMDLRDGVGSGSGAERFSAGLFKLLSAKSELELPFSEFCEMLTTLGAANWTTATYFPYLMWPDRHMFLKPNATKRIAEACGVELNYRPQPNPLTYRCLLDLSERLSDALADLKPKDRIDLQSFIWLVAR